MNKHEPIEPIEDECDAPTPDQIYVGLNWTRELIAKDIAAAFGAAIAANDSLERAFHQQRMVEVKLASEALADALIPFDGMGGEVGKALCRARKNASVLGRKAAEHLNRRKRI